MKKLLSVALISIMVLSFFSFVTYADETYDSTWSIVTDKDSYNAGDYMLLTVHNSTELANRFATATIHITFDENTLEYVTDVDLIYDEFEIEVDYAPGQTQFGEGGEGGYLATDGEFIDVFSANSVRMRADRDVYYLFFKVKDDIKGINELNFRWVLNENDKPSQVGYVLDGDKTEYYYNIDFVNATVKIVGSTLDSEPEVLPMSYAYASENDLGETEINGTPVNITTNYAAAFGKVAARKADAVKLKAGFLLSKITDNMVITNSSLKDFEAVNFSSENIFGGLFYGPGLEAGTTYYVMPYVTYSDGVTLYASEAASFTMPQ